MELRVLEYYLMVAREENITKAAKLLHITQPTLSRQLMAEQTATELLLACPNVKLYNFFDQYEVICNPDYYSDDGHYSGEINARILNWIADGTGLVTKENYLERLEQEREFYSGFDYDSIYK